MSFETDYQQPYWWCDKCNMNVDVLHAPGQGQYCMMCGRKTRVPDNEVKQTLFFEDVFDNTVVDIDSVSEDLDTLGKIRSDKKIKKYNHDEDAGDLDD